jgi:hypothetical protein
MVEAPERGALLAFGRLTEACEACALASAWEARERVGAAARAASADGLGVEAARVFRLAYDLPVRRDMGDVGDAGVMQILALLVPEEEGAPPDSPPSWRRELLVAEARLAAEADPGSPAGLLRNLHRWLGEGGRPSIGYAALVRCFAGAGLVPRPLGVLIRPVGLLRASPTTWVEKALLILAEAADTGRRDLAAFERTVADWRRRLGRRRRNSRLEALVTALAATPVATPSAVARRFGLSLRGASVMLDELAGLGIVAEISGRKSWKTYVAGTDGMDSIGDRRPRPTPLPSPDLDPLLSDADTAIARARDALSRARSRIGSRRVDVPPTADEEP